MSWKISSNRTAGIGTVELILIIVILQLSCSIGTEEYTFVSVYTDDFATHNAVWLKNSEGKSRLVLTSKSEYPQEWPSENDWVNVESALRLRLKLTACDSIPNVEYLKGFRSRADSYSIFIDDFPLGSDQDSIRNLDSAEYSDYTIHYITDGKIMCDVYYSDDLVDTYVRKSAVVMLLPCAQDSVYNKLMVLTDCREDYEILDDLLISVQSIKTYLDENGVCIEYVDTIGGCGYKLVTADSTRLINQVMTNGDLRETCEEFFDITKDTTLTTE